MKPTASHAPAQAIRSTVVALALASVAAMTALAWAPASAAAQAAPAPAPAGAPGIDLFPLLTVVEVSGRVTRGGARIARLAIRAPRGATIRLRCRGRTCPRRITGRTAGELTVFRSLREPLAAGTVLELRVTRGGSIGKYTRLRIARGQEPVRRDSCLADAGAAPTPCPSPIPAPAQVASLATAEGLSAQGFRLIRRGRFSEAVPLFVTAASQSTVDDQTYASALFGLARSLRRLGRAGDALTVIRRRIELPPRTADAEQELALARRAARRARGGPA